MAGRAAVFLGAILLTMVALPMSSSAYNSGGIEASEAQVALIPSTGPVSYTHLTLPTNREV